MFLKHFDFLLSNEILMISAFVLSSSITYFAIPPIIYVSFKKGLVQNPTNRCSHKIKTPVFGGIGIFIGLIFTTSLITCFLFGKNFNSYFAALFILFVMGIKDDIHILGAGKKIFGQIIAALIVILFSDIRINNFHGIFGIYQLNYYLSILISLFIFILIINCYNIIDGIDGLAGSIGIIFTLIIGVFFYILGTPIYTIISFSLMGSLASFLYFNFSTTKKIFMGDTGSIIVGFLIAYLSIIIFSFDRTPSFNALNVPIVLLCLFFYPFIDALRIFLIRVFLLKKNPFIADSNHIHHRLISSGLKHWQATLLLTSITLLLLLICSCLLKNLEINLQILITILFGIFLYSIPFIVININSFNMLKQYKVTNENQK
jgi:UDP-GlcNAc:undecaprenyl-phosphate GlcNAc-1-phosphate transferase